MPQTNNFNPEQWLVSGVRALEEYTKTGIDNAVKDPGGISVGDTVYEVIMEFPSQSLITSLLPKPKSVIHLELDDITNRLLGIGDNIFRDNFDIVDYTVRPQEAREHTLNLDIGIWTWARTGGTTARLRAYQILENLFHGSRAQKALWDATQNGDGGIEILAYTGGRFLTEQINDIPVYRMVDCQLEARVYSRTPMPVKAPAVQTVIQTPNLTIPA